MRCIGFYQVGLAMVPGVAETRLACEPNPEVQRKIRQIINQRNCMYAGFMTPFLACYLTDSKTILICVAMVSAGIAQLAARWLDVSVLRLTGQEEEQPLLQV